MIDEFRKFIHELTALPFPKFKRKRAKPIVEKPLTVRPDEYLTTRGKPFRFSRQGAKRKIEKRKS